LTKRLLEKLEAVGKKQTLNPLSGKVLKGYFAAGVSFADTVGEFGKRLGKVG
jgi:hypothetical protein